MVRKGARPVLAVNAVSTDFSEPSSSVAIRAAGGADTVAVGDLTLTGVKQVDADLGADDAADRQRRRRGHAAA